jgi:hypothetical protein
MIYDACYVNFSFLHAIMRGGGDQGTATHATYLQGLGFAAHSSRQKTVHTLGNTLFTDTLFGKEQ